ncbi:MAG: hypothetical protein HY718_12475 [Planctomycetes bacterium]|nr:hypothetical protein [Planctomycetota bacterium]
MVDRMTTCACSVPRVCNETCGTGFQPVHRTRKMPVPHKALLLFLSLAVASVRAADPGDFNAAAWGTAYVATPDSAAPAHAPRANDDNAETAVDVPAGGYLHVEWRHPRDVYAVELVCRGDVPRPDELTISYWYHVWPDNGGGGWMKVDDPFNGRFVTAATDVVRTGERRLMHRIQSLETAENPAVKATGFDYRRTYKIRIAFKSDVQVAEMRCLTDSRWKPARIRIELPGAAPAHFVGRNAEILSTKPIAVAAAVLDLRYADNPQRLSPDLGRVMIRRGGHGPGFSFFVDDVVRDGVVKLRDGRGYLCDDTKGLTGANWKPPPDAWDATVMDKVAAMPEQTLANAMSIPPKWIPPAHLGLPNLRQELSIDPRSLIYTEFKSLRSPLDDFKRSPNLTKDDSERKYILVTRKNEPFGPASHKSIKRWLEEGYLPVIHSQWEMEGVRYDQRVFVTALDPEVTAASLADPQPAPRAFGTEGRAANFHSGLRGDEPVAILSRLEMENPTDTPVPAGFWLRITNRPPMHIDADGLLVLDAPTKPSAGAGLTPVWGQIDVEGKGELVYRKDFFPKPEKPDAPGEPRDVIRYDVQLGPREKHTVVIKVPYVEQLTPDELAALKGLEWQSSYDAIVRLWKLRLRHAIENYQVPEPALMNLWRANFWHALITTDRDPPTGLYEHGAGTYEYPMYANEAMMVSRSFEMRGEHEEARRIFEPCLVSQGTRGLPGNFKTKDGLLYAAAPPGFDHYTAQGYNMHHGFILWAAAEHYLWTRDRPYLTTVAPNLVAACDWITRERQATKITNPDGSRPLEWGLAPAGDLEDVDEFLYWYATNAYYYLGLKTAADALAEIDHPDASRLAADARAYAGDLMASVRESAAISPVVRLLDGTYIPYVPPRAYVLTDRKEGWIREALYCSLHLLDGGLVEPDDVLVTWILNDLEDRIFMSDESGYGPDDGLKDPRAQFFCYGGVNPQPNLLDNSIAYLKRGQVPNFLRAFFNTYAISIYPDVVCFAESVTFGKGGGPLYKTPDECKFIQWMRLMLVMEMRDRLYLGRGVPRAWMADGKTVRLMDAPTYFGPLDLEITSAAASGEIRADVNLPSRNPARRVYLSLHHPDGKLLRSATAYGTDCPIVDVREGLVQLPVTTGRVRVVARY